MGLRKSIKIVNESIKFSMQQFSHLQNKVTGLENMAHKLYKYVRINMEGLLKGRFPQSISNLLI